MTSKKYHSELHEIGFKYGTDKCYINPDEKSYLHHYEDIMKDKCDREINLLEIGVRDGPCLKMFEEYFYNAKNIIGIDINKKCKNLENEKIKIIIGDSNNLETYKKINEITEENFDFIIDDGSHDINDIQFSFNNLFSKVKPSGYYIIEDLNNLYKKNQVKKGHIFLNNLFDKVNNKEINYEKFIISRNLLIINY